MRVAAGNRARLLVLQKSALTELLLSGAIGVKCVAHLMQVADKRRENREHFVHVDESDSPKRGASGHGFQHLAVI